MAENSKIEWTDHTFNPWMGCTKVSAGCKHCYAETLMDHRYKKVQWGQSYHRFYKVFLVGGGAILLEKHMRSKFNGKSVMADDPVMAIANGLYKIGFGLK